MQKPVDFYEIYGYYETPFFESAYFWIAVIISALLLIGIGIYFYYSKRKKTPLTPWEWATAELKKITIDSCKTKNDYKKMYFSMTTTIKKYFHLRYLWQTEDKTDDELLQFLSAHNFDPSLCDQLKKICASAIWIKFANEDALKTQAIEDLTIVRLIIQKTIPEEK